MDAKVMVVTHSLLNQAILPEADRLSNSALPVVKDLIDLNVHLVQLPDVVGFYQHFMKRTLVPEDFTSPEFEQYVKRTLVPYVDQVMSMVKQGATFLGVLSYRGDTTQRIEPHSSPVMLELFRLFDRNCMLTPYYEISSQLTPEESDLVISDVMEVLGL